MAYNRTYYSNFVSNAGITWRIEMYDQVATATYQNKEGTLGPKAGEMKYGSEGSKMFAPLKPSTFSFEFMVTTQNAANYIKQLKASRQERDVYVAIYRETVNGSNSPIYTPYWAGQVLMDLSDDPDIPMPYPITIKAVDGIASLKYYDYVPSTTSQLASHIYDIGDTYIPDPTNAGGQYDAWQTCIEIISNCLDYSGPFTTTIGSPSNPYIYTFARWFNGEHPNTTIDPLSSTRIKPNMFYKEENEGEDLKYKAQNCYDVLQNLCKAWGMRMYFFGGRYYFTQLNEWRIADSGTQASPVNMKRHGYTMAGTTVATSNAISRFWGQYTLPLTNTQTSPEYKNLKLTGGKYGLLPAFKRVTVDFMNVDNVNSFTSFPLLPSGGTAPVSNGLKWEFSSLGTFTFDGANDQQFFNRINISVSNQGVNPGELTFGWALVARPAGTGSDSLNQSPSNNGWTKYMYLDIANSPPVAWGTSMGSLNSGSMPHNPVFNIGIGTTLVDITAGGIANYPFFPASVFTAGQWEIGYYTKTEVLTTQSVPHSYWSYNGRFVPDSVANPLTNPYMNGVTYTNPAATTGINASEFAPIINGAVGSASTTTNLYQTGDDTAYEEVNDIIMGDTGSNFSEGCIQIYTGTVWKASDFAGFWGIDTLAGGNSFSQQLAEDIFKAQAKSIDKFTVSTTINAENSVYWNDGTANRPQWAAPFTRFNTFSNANQGMVAKKYIMHTGSYDFLRDTWKWVLYEQATFTVGATSTTTTTLGVNSGLSGWGGDPAPVGGGYSSIAPPPNPNSGTGNSLMLLNQQQIQPVAIIRAGQYLAQGTEVQSITVTFLSVKQLPAAIFKIGDKLVLQTKSNDNSSRISESNPQYNTNRIEFVVSANQLINAETISVTSKTIYQDISVGDTITFNAANLYSQYQNKTEGSVAGFEVDADGLTKGGVEITGWLDSDTMAGATVNNLPTALSVKNYVDNSHPAEDQTLQEVTDNGNTTTNSVMIGSTSAPSKRLDIRTNGVGDGIRLATSTNAYFAQIINGNSETFPYGIINLSYGTTTPVRISALSNELQISGGYTTGGKISFRTASTERMRLTDTGLGIGTTAPAEKLDVLGNIKLSTTNSSYRTEIQNNLSYANPFNLIGAFGVEILTLNSGHISTATNNTSVKFGVGTKTPTEKLDVVGTGKFSGQVTIPLTPIATTDAASKAYVDGQAGHDETLQQVTDNGNSTTNSVMIGSASAPTYKLDVVGGGLKTTTPSSNRIAYYNGDGINAYGSTGFSLGNYSGEITIKNEANDKDIIFKASIGTAASSEKMRIKSNGNVGIGTTAPSEKLDVEGVIRGIQPLSVGIVAKLLSYPSSPYGLVIRGENTGMHSIQCQRESNDTQLFPLSFQPLGGNVGIGTTSPQRELHIHSSSHTDIQLTNDTTGVGAGDGSTISASNSDLYINNKEDGNLLFFTANSEKVRITSVGNVGIGTTSPTAKLQIGHTTTAIALSDTDDIINEVNSISIRTDSSANGNIDFRKEGNIYYNTADLSGNRDFTIYEGKDSSSAVVTITGGDNVGNVGIGTTAPDYTLDIQKDTSDFVARIKNINNNGKGLIISAANGGAGTNAILSLTDKNGTIKAKFIEDGSLGIGTSAPSAPLEVNGNVKFGNTTTGLRFNISGTDYEINGMDVGASAWNSLHLKADGNDGLYIQKDTNNVGIGTTAPTETLHIVGDQLLTGNLKVDGSQIDFTNIPTTEPTVSGRLWSDRGTLKIAE